MTSSSIEVMDKLGDYTVLEPIGKGGMGVVYRARHDERGDVAIKVMPGADKNARSRLLREAGLAASLDHPRIIEVYGLGEHRRQPYIVMELLDGINLRELIRSDEDLGLERRLDLMKQVLEALAFAHDAGVAHRDIKPQNIFIESNGNVRVLDFGLACAGDTMEQEKGRFVGTPAYMPPEQARRREVDFRGDIFAVGTVFYELLTGTRAFSGGDVRETLERVKRHHPAPVHQLDQRLPPQLSAIVETAMAKKPDQRYASMREMSEALEAFEGTLASLRAQRQEQISSWVARLGTITVHNPGPVDLYTPIELPHEYFELITVQERLEEQREPFEKLVEELAWVTRMCDAPLEDLDVEELRGIANRVDTIRETWPGEPRLSQLGRRVLEELRLRLPSLKTVDWGNMGRRSGEQSPS